MERAYTYTDIKKFTYYTYRARTGSRVATVEKKVTEYRVGGNRFPRMKDAKEWVDTQGVQA